VNAESLGILKERLLGLPQNQELLRFLQITLDTDWKLLPWPQADCGFDEGGRIFFRKYGKNLPDEVKLTLGVHNLMVNTENGLVFAAHYGRCTFLVRCGLTKIGAQDSDRLRSVETLDGFVDARSLGPDWAILNCFCEEEEQYLEGAYSLSRSAVT
jgi:hypothetical protein